MQGGIHPEFTGETYVELLRAAKRGKSEAHVHAFSPLEVLHGAETYDDGSLNGSVPKFIEILKANGLGSLPGTAAEVLSEEVRQSLCPDKLDSKQWLATVEAAHEADVPTTATMMFGHVDEDTIEARAAHLVAIRDAHLRSVWRLARRKRRETTEAVSDVWENSLAPRGARLFSHTSETASVVSRRFRLASLHTERKCASRIATRCAARASIVSSSTCPNIIVAVVGTSASCAASTVASHCFESSLSGHRLCRTSSDRTSAAVPGSDPNPFAFKISMNFGTEPFKEPSSYVSAP